MKKILLSMAVLLTLGVPASASAQRHRHTPRTETAASRDNKDSKAATADKANGTDAASGNEGIEAYSDTSSTAVDDSTAYASYNATPVDGSNRYDPSRFDDPFSWIAYLCSTSFMGGVLAILVIVLFLIFLFMPLIIVLLTIRYFIRRHNDRVRLAEKAMEEGRPLADEQMPLSRRSPEAMWRRGVKHVSVGIGLMVFFWFLGAKEVVGIGGLLACMGAGQMFMARYSHDSKFGRKKYGDRFDDFENFNGDISDLKFDDNENEMGKDKK